MEHYRHPHNVGAIADTRYSATHSNPVCGDVVSITVNVEGDRIRQVFHQTQGCAIAVASASILTDYLQGVSVAQTSTLSLDKLLELLGTPLTITRRQCAQVALDAVRKALKP